MKRKKIAARFHLIWPSKKQTKQKLASVVIIIYYKWNDICKKIMSFFSDKIPCLCSPKASPPPSCPLNATIFLFIYIISSLCLKQRKKMEQISEKKKNPHPTGKKRKKKSWCKRKKKLRIRVVGTASFLSIEHGNTTSKFFES